MRYDVAIIGAGVEGLAAATLLAKAGHRIIVIERGERAGGRAATREFHPGFRASPFADELAPIPAQLHWALDLSRRGAIFTPAPSSLALWPGRRNVLRRGKGVAQGFLESAAKRSAAILARAETAMEPPPRRTIFTPRVSPASWLGEDWLLASANDVLAREIGDADTAAHVAALAFSGRAADPGLAGSALLLLAPGNGGSGTVVGGLATLAHALEQAAREAGVEISCGLDATDIRRARGRVTGVGLADGTEIEARAVVSTLDLKRTFLTFFQWNGLTKEIVSRVGAFRMAGSTARVLLALDGLPVLPVRNAIRGPIHVAPDLAMFADAYAAWRVGTIADRLPIALRFVSASDPGLAPVGAAVLTATLGCVPFRLFDGAWTREKRDRLRDLTLAAIEAVLPGTTARVLASETIVPPDIEEALGATEGDLMGGEIAADQMLDAGPWPDHPGPRSPIRGLYLAGSQLSTGALATCAAGALAARALAADLATGGLK